MIQDPLYPKLIHDALATVRYPGSGKNIVEAGMVKDDLRIDGRKAEFTIIFDKPTDPFLKSVVKSAETALKMYASEDIEPIIHTETRVASPAPKAPVLPGVKNIVAVSSGKGGVGKSTVAANLAVALAREGYKVGLLDADIFGPSVPKMFDIQGEQMYMEEVDGKNYIIPVEKYGVKLLSIGLLVDPDSAVVWRGGMASNALKQLIEQASWGDLDYFLIDMPPGTSDIHLTLVQTLGITGAVIVSTPQEVALADARKGIAMFRDPKINVPVLGIIENMAWFTPEAHPDERYYIFGNGGARRLADELHIKLLAEIPLVASVGERSDKGTPEALGDSPAAVAFMHLAHEVVDAVEERNATLPPTEHVHLKH